MASDVELPLPDYDSLPVGSIESRIRTLRAEDVRTLHDYETQHANRVQVVQILQHRLASLETGEAEPTGGDPTGIAPEVGTAASAASGDSQASPATEGPPQNPPSQGVPTNPAQPRR
jgi:hypothetical protein